MQVEVLVNLYLDPSETRLAESVQVTNVCFLVPGGKYLWHAKNVSLTWILFAAPQIWPWHIAQLVASRSAFCNKPAACWSPGRTRTSGSCSSCQGTFWCNWIFACCWEEVSLALGTSEPYLLSWFFACFTNTDIFSPASEEKWPVDLVWPLRWALLRQSIADKYETNWKQIHSQKYS